MHAHCSLKHSLALPKPPPRSPPPHQLGDPALHLDQLERKALPLQVQEILRGTAETRQALLFSATLPAALADFAAAGLRAPHVVRLDADTKLSSTLSLAFFGLREADKPAALLHTVQEVLPTGSMTIVFIATKHRVEYLLMLLESVRASCTAVSACMRCCGADRC